MSLLVTLSGVVHHRESQLQGRLTKAGQTPPFGGVCSIITFHPPSNKCELLSHCSSLTMGLPLRLLSFLFKGNGVWSGPIMTQRIMTLPYPLFATESFFLLQYICVMFCLLKNGEIRVHVVKGKELRHVVDRQWDDSHGASIQAHKEGLLSPLSVAPAA